MGRLIRLAVVLAFAGLGATTHAQTPASTVTVFATQPGKPALDGDPFGGNPFATAVIAALGEGRGDDRATLTERTQLNSAGQQRPDLTLVRSGFDLEPSGKAVALVLVFADYGNADDGWASLPGAAFDAARVRAALAVAGYDAKLAIVPNRGAYLARVEAFSRIARDADAALLYTTGHGFEVQGRTYLVPPGFDATDRTSPLPGRTVPLDELRARLGAKDRNLLLYAGCRDNPLNL